MHTQLHCFWLAVPKIRFKDSIHLRHQSMQMRMDRTCNHLLHKTCFGTPPSEVAKHVEKH